MPRMDASKTNWLEVLRNAPDPTMGEAIVRLARVAAKAHREEAERWENDDSSRSIPWKEGSRPITLAGKPPVARNPPVAPKLSGVGNRVDSYEQGGWDDSDGSGSGDAVAAAAAGGAPGSVGKEAD